MAGFTFLFSCLFRGSAVTLEGILYSVCQLWPRMAQKSKKGESAHDEGGQVRHGGADLEMIRNK